MGPWCASHMLTMCFFGCPPPQDIMMERSNGVDVLREAQAAFPATCPTPLPPCFAVTGNASVQEVCSYTEAGFADVLPKPFSMETLRTALVHLVADR